MVAASGREDAAVRAEGHERSVGVARGERLVRLAVVRVPQAYVLVAAAGREGAAVGAVREREDSGAVPGEGAAGHGGEETPAGAPPGRGRG